MSISEENKRNAIANSAANRERNKQPPRVVDWDAVIARLKGEDVPGRTSGPG